MAVLRRPAAAALLLLAVYLGLSFLNSPRGFLGTDTGGKVATLKVMSEQRSFDPDVGYWAEQWDPEGSLHPLALTSHIGDRWVNVTTLPALWLGWLLYGAGGYRAALLVPIAGSIAGAFAARALLHRLGVGDADAWKGYWLVGLASPLTIYALDFWEHSLGVALIAWATVALLDHLDRGRWWRLVVAGALFGLAATMRTEALVYLFVATAATALLLVVRRERTAARWLAAAAVPLLLAAGALVPLAANAGFERLVLGEGFRESRAAGTAIGAGDEARTRLEEAGITTVGFGGGVGTALGGVVTFLLLMGSSRWLRERSRLLAGASLGAVAASYAGVFATGLQFVPGLVPAAPVAAAVVAGRAQPRRAFERSDAPQGSQLFESEGDGVRWRTWFVLSVALLSVPLVLMFQYVGGAGPQWGARYLLPSSLLLVVAGWARLASAERLVRRVFVGLSVAVTAFGLAWLSVRSHQVDRTIAALERRTEPVLVSRLYHLTREGGATYGERRWLTMHPGETEAAVVGVLDGAGVDEFAVVDLAGRRRPGFEGFEALGTADLQLFEGVRLTVTTWRRDR